MQLEVAHQPRRQTGRDGKAIPLVGSGASAQWVLASRVLNTCLYLGFRADRADREDA